MPERSEDTSPADPAAECVSDVFVEREEHRITLTLHRAATLPVAAKGKQHLRWRPENALITWTRERIDRGRWQAWSASLTILGPHVRTDGTDSKSTHVLDGRRALADTQWAWVLDRTHPHKGDHP